MKRRQESPLCENCQNFDPIGEGDHICDQEPTKMPVSEYEPTEDYLWCQGKHFISKTEGEVKSHDRYKKGTRKASRNG